MRSAWLPALCWLVACGAWDGGSSGIVSGDQFQALFETAQCDRAIACGTYPDRDTCRAALGMDQKAHAGSCTALAAGGATCFSAGDCASGVCTDGFCEAPSGCP